MESLPEIVNISETPQIKNNDGNKKIAIGIFIIVGILLLLYIIYMYEAYRHHWFPFPKFEFTSDNMPPHSILALGEVKEEPVANDDNMDELEATVEGVLASNVAWYTAGGSAAVKVQGDVLGKSTE